MSSEQTTTGDQKLSVTQVADEIGCHPNTVWNHIKRGQLAAVRFGPRVVRVRRSDLDRFISSYHQVGTLNWLHVNEGKVSS